MAGNTMPPIVIDTREKTPFDFGTDVRTTAGTLDTGDYSLAGLEEFAAIERKSLPDLCACVTRDRDRFTRELHRLQAYRCRAVIIEADVAEVVQEEYRSKVAATAVIASVAAWTVRYRTPFMFCGKHGGTVCLQLLRQFNAYIERVVAAVAQDGASAEGQVGQ